MRIVFRPALGETVHVSAGSTRKHTTQLHFTATLTSADYEQVASGHVKLQVWSDIGRNSGEWGETEFKPLFTPLPLNEHGFSLVVNQPEGTRTRLGADLSVPLSGHPFSFSFTYRILYPDGQIKWLGHYGQNGTLVLDRAHDPVILGEDWANENDSYHWNSNGRPVQDLEVANLSRPSDYIAYPVPENSFLHPKDSSVIVLVPRLSSDPVIVPLTLVFGATPSGSISFIPRGTITASGTPSLSFAICESPEDAEVVVSRVIHHHTSPQCQVVNVAPGVLVLASAPNKYPVEVAIIPMATSNPIIQSSLTLRSLASLISGKSPFFVFSFNHRNARFFEIDGALDERISFTASQSGGQFVVAPAHTINYDGEQWRVGIMSSSSTPSVSGSAEGLPTPPPSPRLRPLTHRVPAQSPDPSFLSLPAAISSEAPPLSRSSSQLVVNSKRRNGVLAVIGHIFMVLITWLTGIFRRPGLEVQPKRTTVDERTPLLQEETSYAQLPVEVSTDDNAQQASSSKQIRVAGLSVDIGGGETTILFQTAYPTYPFNVPIQLNGRKIDVNVQTLDEGILVVDFSSAAGGSLKIG
ncbi:hypothetical protein B0H19DRAFT_1254422 [Mycena capillaripes]|nr:hypothetical protein B0H19DRAFT_1254422 [Mycena capillaripes]